MWERLLKGLTALIAAVMLFPVISSAAAQEQGAPVRLAILNTVGNANSAEIFRESIGLLRVAWQRPVKVTYYDIPGLFTALDSHSVDFFIANPGFFATAQSRAHARHLATLKIHEAADPNESMGGVFLVRSDSSVRHFTDMKGRTAAAVSPSAFGGYLVSLGEIQKRGEDPENFFRGIRFTGYPMQVIFDEVRSGNVEVGMVRACLLEEMIAKGKIAENAFRVVEGVRDEKLACQRSTELYPDWVFAVAPTATPELSRRAAAALLSMPETHGIHWSIATDFRRIDELYRSLRVEHYAYLRSPTIRDFLMNYRWSILAVLFGLFLVFSHYLLVNIEVKRKTRSLREASAAREEAQAKALATQRRLHNLERVSLVGMLSNMVAHELKQPISAIANFADGIRSINAMPYPERDLIDGACEDILGQTKRAATIIERVRSYAKELPRELESVRIADVVRQAEEDLRSVGSSLPSVRTDVPCDLMVKAERVELTLVVLNLLKNAAEALKHEKNGRIAIGAYRNADTVILSVEDNGRTSDISGFQDVFAPKPSSKADGLGIGLAISARMIERFGGNIRVESVVPHGVRVILTLPATAENEPFKEDLVDSRC